MGVSNIKNGAIYPTKNFGDVEVVNYIDKYHVDIRFINTGSLRTVVAKGLRKGQTLDYAVPTLYGVGYIDYGCHSTREADGKSKTRAYVYWSRMLKRCYDKEGQDYPMYGGKGVTVCEDWHNFQNFSGWFNKQKFRNNVGWHLDKDLAIVGNKVYCPEACNLVPPIINLIGVGSFSGKLGRTTSGKWRFRDPTTGKPSISYLDKKSCILEYGRVKVAFLESTVNKHYKLGDITKKLRDSILSQIKLIPEKVYNLIKEEKL